MHADEPDRRYGHEIQNLSFVMRIALGIERPVAERKNGLQEKLFSQKLKIHVKVKLYGG